MAGTNRGNGPQSHQYYLDDQKNEVPWGRSEDPGGVLEERGQGAAGAGLPSVALWPDHSPVPGPGQGQKSGHGRYSWAVGAIPHQSARTTRA